LIIQGSSKFIPGLEIKYSIFFAGWKSVAHIVLKKNAEWKRNVETRSGKQYARGMRKIS
jgi:hypothetical protein